MRPIFEVLFVVILCGGLVWTEINGFEGRLALMKESVETDALL
jgi:hypothetical protein